MSKGKTNFEQIPVEVVKKIAKLRPARQENVVSKKRATRTQPYATAVTAAGSTSRRKGIFEEN